MNLRYWRDPQKISRHVAREVLKLSEYDLEIHHIKGTLNGRADASLRRPDYDQGEDDNKDVVVLPDNLFVRASHLEWIEEEEPRCVFQVEDMTKEHPIYEQDEKTLKTWVDPHRLKKIHSTWYKDGRRVVTNNLEHRQSLIQSHHDPLVYGHPGINRMIHLLEWYYWWPGLQKEVAEYVQGCAECQRHKVNNRPTRAALSPIYLMPEALPFDMIELDFITKLPESQGFDSILTITDHDCTKLLRFIPCREEINAEETAALYTKHIFLSHRLPSKIISDRDPRFALRFTRELCNILDIRQNIFMAYHPHTDGQSERTNQWLEQYLHFWTNEHQDNWATYLPMAEFTHNNWLNETTCESPFFLLMGYNPCADWTDRPWPIPQVALCLDQFKQA